jgi:NodT family efflux transporter outer membrane factor (OMF) lipoprotein
MKRSFSLCLIALACAGCSPIGPDYVRPELNVPTDWKTLPGANASLWKIAQPADGQPKDKWWTRFEDKTLSELIERCLENNNTLQASLARLDQAIAQSEARSAALFPTISVSGTGSRTLTSANRPTATYDSVNIQTVQNDFRPVALMTYEIDWLGKVRRDVEASRNTADQAAADTENVRLLLTAQVATSYILLRQYDEEIRVLTMIVGLQEKLLGLIQKRYDLGAAGQTELSQQKALVQSSGAQLEILNNLRNLQENLLATLTATPAASFKLPAGRLPQTLPAFPVSVPSNLLERRPDVAAAERAMAAFFPSLLVAPGFIGGDSTNISTLLNLPSLLWSIGLTATQTIFDSGRTSANYRFAQAGYAATLANYRQVVLVAIQETQDAMSGIQQFSRARLKQDEAVTNLNRALRVSAVRYREGLDTAQTLALLQQNQLTAERVKWQMHGNQFLANIALVKALGGGWEGFKQTEPIVRVFDERPALVESAQ